MNILFRNHFEQSANIVALIALYVMLFSSIAAIFWAADKGLGLGDEGVYLLSARFPEDILQNVSAVYVYTGLLYRLADYDPAAFRLVGMVLILAAASIFWIGFDRFFMLETKSFEVKYLRPESLAFILIGAMLYYQWFFATPNNYTLTAIAINIFLGTLLFGLSLLGKWSENRKQILAVFSATGLSIGLALFTKITTGVSLALLYCLFVYLYKSISARLKVTVSTAVAFGVGLWFAGHFILVLPPEPSWRMFKEGWALYQSFGVHVPRIKIFLYSTEIFHLFYSAARAFWPCYIIIFGVFIYSFLRGKSNDIGEKASSCLLFLALLVAAFMSMSPAIHIDQRMVADKTIPFYLVFHLAWVLLLLTIVAYELWRNQTMVAGCGTGTVTGDCAYVNKNTGMILILLIALPFAGAVGTANPIFNVTGFYSAPWFGAVFLLLLTFVEKSRSYWLLHSCAVLIAAFTTSQIIQGSIFNPQQLASSLIQQVVPTDVGFPVRTLKLDAQTHALVQELTSIAKENGFQQGDDIVAISYLPSLVFAMGGRSPGHPAFLTGSKAAEDYSKLALQFADIARLRKALVLINTDAAEAVDILSSRGLDFPGGYERIGTVDSTSAYGAKSSYSLWKPVEF
ncbi:MAG: hypothetical protein H6942_01090 [Candidatus Accumulibacter sp.]|uniref:hypothetical protein n=1 Tax=Accumulibacter sp. TaxID=2053492 RepID=UPI001A0E3EB0|nr:hypothetical protein [Accumulibacter sp.]MBE2258261.1 hypothetical protein [Paracoccaceae bacterium]MCB1941054.1 hypothetical protein [Accumulibacter sp.]MCP5247130.1 hypothetical protein [Accumulibacter sp.]